MWSKRPEGADSREIDKKSTEMWQFIQVDRKVDSMIIELNNMHNYGSKAQRTIEVLDGEVDIYQHENGSFIISANGKSHLICNAFQFLLNKYRDLPLFKEFSNFWKTGYIMNGEGKTINPIRPPHYDHHSPLGFDKVIDDEFMTKRWKYNPNLFFTLDDLAQTLRGVYNADPSLLFSEYGEEAWTSTDEWITVQINDACRRLVEGHISVYGEVAIQNQLNSTNLKRVALQLKEITMEELKSGDYSFLDSETSAA